MLYERTALSKKPDKLIRHELAALREEDKLTPDLERQERIMVDGDDQHRFHCIRCASLITTSEPEGAAPNPSNAATAQFQRNPQGGSSFSQRLLCSLLTERWPICSSFAPRLREKSLPANVHLFKGHYTSLGELFGARWF